jgi:ribosomal-protein-serine acetyltransferase
MHNIPVSRLFPASALHIDVRNQRLTLRPLNVTDAPQIVEAIAESVPALRRFMLWAHVPQTLEGQIQRIQGTMTPGLRGQEFIMGLFDARNRFLAGCGLHPNGRLNTNALEVGYWCRSSESGKGYATLSSQILITYAFAALGCDKINISHNAENLASQKVIANCGFQFEGTVPNLTDAPTLQEIIDGYTTNRQNKIYGLLPDHLADLSWYQQLQQIIKVTDCLGQDRGTYLAS